MDTFLVSSLRDYNVLSFLSYESSGMIDEEDSVPVDLDTGNHGDSDLDSDEEVTGFADSSRPMYVLPLYSLLASDKQKKVSKL